MADEQVEIRKERVEIWKIEYRLLTPAQLGHAIEMKFYETLDSEMPVLTDLVSTTYLLNLARTGWRTVGETPDGYTVMSSGIPLTKLIPVMITVPDEDIPAIYVDERPL